MIPQNGQGRFGNAERRGVRNVVRRWRAAQRLRWPRTLIASSMCSRRPSISPTAVSVSCVLVSSFSSLRPCSACDARI
eukprot:6105591-Prymnesium_polylepis.2